MAAQHVPHAPLWRRVFSLPETRLGWWAVGLAGPSLILTVFFKVSEVLGWTFLRPDVAATGSSDQYPLLIIAWMLSGLTGGVVGLISAARRRERSWLVWVAMVPGLIFFSYFVWAVTSMSIGRDADPVVTFPFSVLILVVIAFLIGMRKSGQSR